MFHLAPFVTLMVDETDVSNQQLAVVCLQWVEHLLEAHEDFIGMYETQSMQASVIHSMVKDVLCRLGVSVKKNSEVNVTMPQHLCLGIEVVWQL